ncbi:hypothetical protein PAXINDRAFT_92968, partial [Paxillus involutus ATCC 200175]
MISGHGGSVNGIAYLPGGERLVTCSHDGTARIWNVENGEQEGMAMEHGGRVWGLAITSDGKKILSGSPAKGSSVWDVEMRQPMAEWGGHEATFCCIAMSPDDQLVTSDRTVRFWIADSGDPIGETSQHENWVQVAIFSPSNEFVACGKYCGKVSI